MEYKEFVKRVQEAVSQGEIADILRELPSDCEELFTGQPKGPLSPGIAE